ncbi:hypothetical protein M885DRAFT_576646 [Pelagophyceae sp. CCMP2097]|nr:hypothetical protein M885DRAFT_576646 [Pelagophyceae sp. CCMP2097]
MELRRLARLAESLAQIALRKLQCMKMDVSKLTMNEIDALLVRVFAAVPPKGAKPLHVLALPGAIDATPGRLDNALGAVDELRVDETHKDGKLLDDTDRGTRAAHTRGVGAGDVLSDGDRDANSKFFDDASPDARAPRGCGFEADDVLSDGGDCVGKLGGELGDAGDVLSDGGRNADGKLSYDASSDARAPRGRGLSARVPRGGGLVAGGALGGGLDAGDDLDDSGDDVDETTLLLEDGILKAWWIIGASKTGAVNGAGASDVSVGHATGTALDADPDYVLDGGLGASEEAESLRALDPFGTNTASLEAFKAWWIH